MKKIALILTFVATPVFAQEQAIQLKDPDILCTSPEAAYEFDGDNCVVAKAGFYTIVRQFKAQNNPYTFRCVKPVEASGKCQWVMRLD